MIRKVGYGRILALEDNLKFLRRLPDNFVDLIYIDPPFFTQATHRGTSGTFEDRWECIDDFVHFLDFRLREIKRVLKSTGSIYVHSNDRAVHYLKVRMDAIFGIQNFRNHIRWDKTSVRHHDSRKYARNSEDVLFYSENKAIWNAQYTEIKESSKKAYRYKDDVGFYVGTPLHVTSSLRGGGYLYTYKGLRRLWKYPKYRMEELEKMGKVHHRLGGVPQIKAYLKDAKVSISDVISVGGPRGVQRTGYPTQKPEKLLEILIKASSNPGDTVLDCFCGSGTTLVVAEKLKRKWIGCDSNPDAIKTTIRRLRALKE